MLVEGARKFERSRSEVGFANVKDKLCSKDGGVIRKGGALHEVRFERNSGNTDAHAVPKEMFVRPLGADARERLADPMDREEWTCRATPVTYTREELRSLRELFAEMPDCRRGQGMKHKLATVLSVCALARLAGVSGPAGTERFAKYLSQEEMRALRAWRDPDAGRWVAPSDSTLCRVLADTDPDALQEVLRRWAAPRAVPNGSPPALAADGKRIRAHSGEVDHRFRCKADHRFRSKWSPVGAKRRGVGIMSCGDRFGSRFGVFSHGLSFEVELVGAVHEAVEDGIGQGWVADDVMPVLDGKLAGGDGGAYAVAVLDDLEQVAAVLGAELGQPPVVDDQDLGLGERGEQLGIASVGACDGQLGQEPWQAQVPATSTTGETAQ